MAFLLNIQTHRQKKRLFIWPLLQHVVFQRNASRRLGSHSEDGTERAGGEQTAAADVTATGCGTLRKWDTQDVDSQTHPPADNA